MLRRSITQAFKPQCRNFTTTPHRKIHSIPSLPNATLETFRSKAFIPALPALLPAQFKHLPAIQNWFSRKIDSNDASKDGDITLNTQYLEQFSSTIVPLEITTQNGQFARIEQPLSFFLEATTSQDPNLPKIYLAQAPLSTLPPTLLSDIPTPSFVTAAGKGDIYSSSIWLGKAPTYTPLHRDPNPNLFIQLAGKKRVRMFKPHIGLSIFDAVQEKIGGTGNATMRGEEMMEGAERQVLEDEVWKVDGNLHADECWEAEVGSGDGLFIPKGWWHSIRSASGEGFTGSVNWWFR